MASFFVHTIIIRAKKEALGWWDAKSVSAFREEHNRQDGKAAENRKIVDKKIITLNSTWTW
jgi:hypothetical protein